MMQKFKYYKVQSKSKKNIVSNLITNAHHLINAYQLWSVSAEGHRGEVLWHQGTINTGREEICSYPINSVLNKVILLSQAPESTALRDL